MKQIRKEDCDVLLIGAGVMSATLGSLLKQLDPKLSIRVVERLPHAALESSGALNNAGTGHAGFCELNYTPQLPNGNIHIQKAVDVNEAFYQSKQFWSYLAKNGHIDPSFIHSVPHMSFVHGEANVTFLRKRYEALRESILFADMEYTEDFDIISSWCPLVTEGRDRYEPIAATRVDRGTDVNFEELTDSLVKYLERNGVGIDYNFDVHNLTKEDNKWTVSAVDRNTHAELQIRAKFVFIGAGGAALTLLEKSHIKEAKGHGGFPVSGSWLICDKEEVVSKHNAKVYGKAAIGAPPMSVPHLDTRVINGKKCLLFGPYAGFSTKFLKAGSSWDLPKSITFGNVGTMLSAGAHNIPLTKYLIQEVFKSDEDKFEYLREYFPTAKREDWKEAIAGQRVQIIKKGKDGEGVIEFGTEIVSAGDNTLAALLGASPGASTSVSIMLKLIEDCFPMTIDWDRKINQMIPSYKNALHLNKDLFNSVEDEVSTVLGLSKELHEEL
jgi:malate dehydrogenase (quinone)